MLDQESLRALSYALPQTLHFTFDQRFNFIPYYKVIKDNNDCNIQILNFQAQIF